MRTGAVERSRTRSMSSSARGTLLDASEDADGVKITIHVFVTQRRRHRSTTRRASIPMTRSSSSPRTGRSNRMATATTARPRSRSSRRRWPTWSSTSPPRRARPPQVVTPVVHHHGPEQRHRDVASRSCSPTTCPAPVTLVTADGHERLDVLGLPRRSPAATRAAAWPPANPTVITIDVTVNTNATAPIPNTASVPIDPGDPGALPPIDQETNTDNNTDSVTTNISGSGFDLARLQHHRYPGSGQPRRAARLYDHRSEQRDRPDPTDRHRDRPDPRCRPAPWA